MKTLMKEIVDRLSKMGVSNEKFEQESAEMLDQERKQMLEFGMACLTEMDAYKNGMNFSVDQAVEEIFKNKYPQNHEQQN